MTTDRLARLTPDDAALARHTAQLRDTVVARAVGRRPARSRLWPTVLGAAAGVGVLAVATTFLPHSQRPAADQAFDRADPETAYVDYGAFSVAHTLFIGNRRVRFAEKIKSLYYTSEGVVVRHGARSELDDAGPSHYSLVAPDGRRTDWDLDLGDRVPATSPDSPWFAFAEAAGRDRWRLVLLDTRTGRRHATHVVPGRFTWGGWEAPPVSTDGGRVWALMDAGWVEWDATSGRVRAIPRRSGAATPLAAAGGRYLEQYRDQVLVRDFASDEVVGRLHADDEEGDPADDLAPDGRAVRSGESFAVYDEHDRLIQAPRGGALLDLSSGRRTRLGSGPWGWTPGGSSLRVDAKHDRVTACSPSTGLCRTVHEDVPSGPVRTGGSSYES